MLKHIRVFLLGTGTGKREIALLLVLCWIVAFGFSMYSEFYGNVLNGANDLLSMTSFPILSFCAIAFGLEWYKKNNDESFRPDVFADSNYENFEPNETLRDSINR